MLGVSKVYPNNKQTLKDIYLSFFYGAKIGIIGLNGSGKSTLAYSIAGHPKYSITGGEVSLDGANILEMSVDERAKAGLFLAMQYPVEVPGVSVTNFLRTGIKVSMLDKIKVEEKRKKMMSRRSR